MENKKLKEQKGFAGSDAIIALLIISLFAGLIATISYNIYLSNTSVKRMSKATGYIVDVFEYIDKINYDEINEENLISYFNNKYYYKDNGNTIKTDAEVKMKEEQEENITTPYKAEINIIKYNQTEGNTDKLDFVQEITMIVRYRLGNREQKIEMKRIIINEKYSKN